MNMTPEMDAGDVWYTETFTLQLEKVGTNIETLEHDLGYAGGFTFSKVIEKIMDEEIEPRKQDSSLATYTRKYTKQDGNVNSLMQTLLTLEAKKFALESQGLKNEKIDEEIASSWNKLYRTYIAFTPWPGISFDFKNPKSGKILKVEGIAEKGDTVVVVSGMTFGVTGASNMLFVEYI